jgi:hypothetical protein
VSFPWLKFKVTQNPTDHKYHAYGKWNEYQIPIPGKLGRFELGKDGKPILTMDPLPPTLVKGKAIREVNRLDSEIPKGPYASWLKI